jgi:hypothetical protein
VPAAAGPRPFQRQKRRGIVAPTFFIEIDGEEKARLILEHRVNARHERLARRIGAGQVCQRITSSVTGRKRRCGHSAHLIRGFSQMPRTHSLAQAGA